MSKKSRLRFRGRARNRSACSRNWRQLSRGSADLRRGSHRPFGVDLWALSQEGPKEQLDETQNTQPAMLCAGMSVMRVMDQQMGCRRWCSLATASVNTRRWWQPVSSNWPMPCVWSMRGRFMQEAVPAGTGAMAAILGLDDDQVVRSVPRARRAGRRGGQFHPRAGGCCRRCRGDGAWPSWPRQPGAKRALAAGCQRPFALRLMRPAAERLAEAMHAMRRSESLDCRCCTTSA